MDTDFHSFENFKFFIDRYSTFAEFSVISIYRDYDKDEYLEILKNVLNQSANKLEKYKKAFIKDKNTYII